MLKKLKGRRTYIIAILSALMGLIWAVDVFLYDNPETPEVETGWPIPYAQIAVLLGGGGLAALRAGVKNGH